MNEREPASGQEREPVSVPAILTDEQVAIVRNALSEYAKDKRPHDVAASLGYVELYLRAVRKGEIRPSVHFAAELARVLGTDLETLLALEGA